MVREIIHVQVGQCGNQVGTAFWKSVMQEHFLDLGNSKFQAERKKSIMGVCDEDGDGVDDALEKIDVYFRASQDNKSDPETKFTARAVVVDLEPGTIDVINNGPIASVFKRDNMIFGNNGAGNNWAKGHYTEGAEIVEKVLNAVRNEIEGCEAPQGFQLFHSLGGGTGSGMGTLLLLKIRDNYPDRITSTYSIYPSPKVSDTVVEPYNAVLSSHQLLENADETFIIDNEALYNIAHNTLKMKQPQYKDLNALIAQATCGVTASLRFPGKLNSDLRKLGVNLVPFPRLHFFLVSQAPLFNKENSEKTKLTVQEILTQSFSEKNFYSNVKPTDGKYLAGSFSFRGDMTTQEVDEKVEELQTKNADSFVEWIPNNLKTSIVVTPMLNTTSDPVSPIMKSCTYIANTTALKGIFQRLATQFGAMYRRKAFLHWYKNEGMDEMEFQEADKNVRDLITEYQDKQDATYDEEEDEDEEDL